MSWPQNCTVTWVLFFRVLRRAWDGWAIHRGTSLSASLAYYVLLSLVPVISATVALVAWFMGSATARHILTSSAQGAFGASVAQTLSATLKPAHASASSGFTALFGLGIFLAGGSGVAGELRSSLNLVWGVPTAVESWHDAIRNRTREIFIVFALLFAVLAVSIASLIFSAAGHLLTQALPTPTVTILIGNVALSLGVLLFLFLLLHKYVPDADVSWRRAIAASLCTATLFTLGKEILTAYIRKSTVGSAFGPGQSVIALLLWGYFSSAVVLLGAECANAWVLETTPNQPPTHLKAQRDRRMTKFGHK